jgi:predicted nucleic acid-binding protein
MTPADERHFIDAGIFIGAILLGDPRHSEAYPLVEAARRGEFRSCTSVGVLSEVYGALTWTGSVTPHTPADAARSVGELVQPPSAIEVLQDGLEVSLLHLQLAERHRLTARRIHDARHAATALYNNVSRVYTYDPADWRDFLAEGIVIAGPPSTLAALAPAQP